MASKAAQAKRDAYFDPFPKRLRELMKGGGVTQQVLADAINVKRQTVAAYADGGVDPTLSRMIAMAQFFGVSLDYLAGKEECQTPDNEAIHKRLGLTDIAIKNLEYAKGRPDDMTGSVLHGSALHGVNALLESPAGFEILKIVAAYILGDLDVGYIADNGNFEDWKARPVTRVAFISDTSIKSAKGYIRVDARDFARAMVLRVPGLLDDMREARNRAEGEHVDQESAE